MHVHQRRLRMLVTVSSELGGGRASSEGGSPAYQPVFGIMLGCKVRLMHRVCRLRFLSAGGRQIPGGCMMLLSTDVPEFRLMRSVLRSPVSRAITVPVMSVSSPAETIRQAAAILLAAAVRISVP